MIYLFSDFSTNGPYVGQLKSVLYEQTHNAAVIDLMHDAPIFNSQAASHLLAASLLSVARDSIVLAIVDPGVGSKRKGVAIRADSRWYVGPDNGLFDVVAARAHSSTWYEITYQNKHASNSFHGRDIFAPVTAMLCNETPHEQYLKPLERESNGGDDLMEIIYVDAFGNLMSGIRASSFDDKQSLWFGDVEIKSASTFSDVNKGDVFCYENSQGLLEIAINQGSAKAHFNASIGDKVGIR